ncbi:hypothetical protein [Streptomyces incarnatus]|uniref:hypothetical protein n=1 Tax=Streptomyces incarnatus TaxID=665007 RepID=UPI000A727A22
MRDERHGRAALPDPRSRSGAFGHRLPRTGTEPATARSAPRLRRLLSAVFLPLFARRRPASPSGRRTPVPATARPAAR